MGDNGTMIITSLCSVLSLVPPSLPCFSVIISASGKSAAYCLCQEGKITVCMITISSMMHVMSLII